MAANKSIGRLVMDMVANTAGFTKNINTAKNGLRASAKSMKNDIGLITGALKTVVSIAALKQGLDYFDRIDSALKRIKVSTTSTTIASKNLQDIAWQAYKSMPGSIDSASNAVIALSNYTNTTEASMLEATKTALAYSKVLGQDVSESVKSVSQSLNSWGIDTKHTQEAMDLFYKISVATGMSVQDIGKYMGDQGSELKKAGMSYKEAAIFMGELERGGINVRKSMAGLARAFTVIAREGDTSFVGGFAKLNKEIKEARRQEDALLIATKYFGTENARLFTDIFRNGNIEFDKLKDKIDSITSVLGAEGETRTLGDNFSNVIKGLGDQSVAIMESLKDSFVKLETPLKVLVGVISVLVSALNTSIGEIGNLFSKEGLNKILDRATGAYRDIFKSTDIGDLDNTEYKLPDYYALGEGDIGYSSALDQSGKSDTSELSAFAKKWEEIKTSIADSKSTLSNEFTSFFTDTIQGTKGMSEAFQDMATSIINSLAKIAIQKSIVDPIIDSVFKFFNLSTTTDGATSSTSSATSTGTSAAGGSVSGNNPYLVGEFGPEIFTPETNGNITPNKALLGNNLNFSFSVAADTPSAVEAKFAALVNRFNQQVPSIVANAMSSGGTISRKLRR